MNSDQQTPKLILYWLVVGLPLAWGVYHTLTAAIKLFAQ
ncbi:MFS transporter small subunit [Acidiphilium sp.]